MHSKQTFFIEDIVLNNIKRLQAKWGLKDKELAEMMGVSPSHFSQIIRKDRGLLFKHLNKLCNALNYSAHNLFTESAFPQEELPPGQVAQNPADPIEGALVEIFRGLTPRHKGKLIGVAEDLRLSEALPPRKSKKVSGAP